MRITDLCMIADVKDEYIKLRQNGSGRSDAVKALIETYDDELTIGQDDDGLLFWVGLADGQCHFKELESEIAEKATDALCTIETYDWDVTPGDIVRRKEKYKQAPMPEHKVGKSRKFRCQWQIGDTFAYQLNGEAAAEKGLAGEYVLIRKVEEEDDGTGIIVPVVTTSFLGNGPLPQTDEEFSSIPLVRLNSGKQFTPEYLFEYRMRLLFATKKQVESIPLIYVGRFVNVSFPKDEVIFTEPGMRYRTYWNLPLSKYENVIVHGITRYGLSK